MADVTAGGSPAPGDGGVVGGVPGENGATGTDSGHNGAPPLLSVRGLKKHFPIYGGLLKRQVATVYAVDGVDFDVQAGEIFSLVGESGCGKTTLGRSLLRLIEPTAGTVNFEGRS